MSKPTVAHLSNSLQGATGDGVQTLESGVAADPSKPSCHSHDTRASRVQPPRGKQNRPAPAPSEDSGMSNIRCACRRYKCLTWLTNRASQSLNQPQGLTSARQGYPPLSKAPESGRKKGCAKSTPCGIPPRWIRWDPES